MNIINFILERTNYYLSLPDYNEKFEEYGNLFRRELYNELTHENLNAPTYEEFILSQKSPGFHPIVVNQRISTL